MSVLAISDHYPVCITRKFSKSFNKGPVHKFITYSKWFNETNFLYDLENQPWSVIDIFDNASGALDFFTSIFNSILSNHAPKKQRRVKRQKQPNWVTNDILQARKIRDQYNKIFKYSTIQYLEKQSEKSDKEIKKPKSVPTVLAPQQIQKTSGTH